MIQPNANARRSSILLSKIIQAIANQPKEPFNEVFMQKFTSFVVPKYQLVNELLETISSNAEEPQNTAANDENVIETNIPIVMKGIASFKSAYLKEFYNMLEKREGTKTKLLLALS